MLNLVQSLWGTGLSPAQTPSSSAPSATHTRTRDRDLISSDELLTDDALDELWTWFCGAAKDGTDLQLVFVKLINSARKPYMEHSDLTSTGSRSMIPATPRSGTSSIDMFRLWRRGSSTSTACDTPSERTVADHDPAIYGYHSSEPTTTQLQAHQALQTTVTQLRQENTQLQSKAQALETTVTELRNENTQLQNKAQSLPGTIPAPVRVAIKSVHFGGRYVSMNGSSFRSYQPGGGAHVKVQTFIGRWETFELVRHPGNLVSFKSTCFDNVFIRAEARGLCPRHTPGHGGGLVNGQYGCGKLEKFRLKKVGEHGEVAIEPAEFPGRFFRVDGNWLHGMNLQGTVSAWERFYLVVVP